MDKEEYANWNNYVNGTFTGVGITFAEDDEGNFVITDILNGGPADSAGLKEDDILLTVDGKSYDDSRNGFSSGGKEGWGKGNLRRGGQGKRVSLVQGKWAAFCVEVTIDGITVISHYICLKVHCRTVQKTSPAWKTKIKD